MYDVSISGSGNIAPGEYAKVKCSGSGKIDGDIKCESISISGSAKANGKIDCSGKASFSGSFSCDGEFKADNCSCSGSTKFNSSVFVREFQVSGSTKIEGGCNAELIKISGGVVIGGLLNADTAEFELGFSSMNRVGSIGGTKLSVKKAEHAITSFLGNVFNFFNGNDNYSHSNILLSTSVIEEDYVDIEYVDAETVRIIDGRIGAGCHIKTLEYSGTVTVDETAKIDNLVPVASSV